MKHTVLSCIFLLAIIVAGIILFPNDSKRINKVINMDRNALIKEDTRLFHIIAAIEIRIKTDWNI